MEGVQKCGYLEVKEPSCIKGRKLKTWRRRWAVLQEMSNLASGTLAAKLEFFLNETSSKINPPPTDKQTYLLENVTAVEPCHSKTHKLAFQIVQTTPTLVLCTESQEETDLWVSAFNQIFLPNQNTKQDGFKVTVVTNDDAKRCNISGEYRMVITPEVIAIEGTSGQPGMEWRLDCLKRFYMDKNRKNILFIESGAKASCGEANFEFQTALVHSILQAIKTNINKAIELRRRNSGVSQDTRDRTMSMEKGFHNLLTNSDQRSRTSSMNSNVSATRSAASSPTLSIKRVLEKTAILEENENSERLRCNSLNMASNGSSLEGSKESLNTHSRSLSLDGNSIKRPHQYDILILKEKKNVEVKPEIVATVSVTTESSLTPVEIMLDSHGYSHIPADVRHKQSLENSEKEVKNGTQFNFEEDSQPISSSTLNIECLSNQETNETVVKSDLHLPVDTEEEKRSLSVGSHDSGVSCPSSYQPSTTDEKTHRSKESFDSAISYSEISVSIPEAIVVSESINSGFVRSFSHPHSMYLNELKHERSHSEPTKTVANETSEYANVESEYEDLDKYRKDLKKFLGMSDKHPDEVPPSLPERPSSLPPSRRVIKDTKKKRVSFTAFGHSRSSSSSDSEDAEHEVTALASWPIKQNTGNNSLYSKVERNTSAVAETKSDYDQNLYETIPAAAADERKESPISSIKTWPLQRTAQAHCNRFYESNDTVSKQLPSPNTDTPTTAVSPKEGQEASKDFLTGDIPLDASKTLPVLSPSNVSNALPVLSPSNASKTLPVLSPSKQAPVVDLLSGDIQDQSNKLPVLDVLLPFSMDDIKRWKTETEVKLRQEEDVQQNPFPNIARYSGAMESFAEISEISSDDPKTLPGCSDQLVSGSIENEEPSDKTETDLINFDEIESYSNPASNAEDLYIPMEQKESEYVQPSELQLYDK